MKNLMIPSLITVALIVLIGATGVNAETRYKYYEMVDGTYVKFMMSPEESKAQNAENARMEAIRKVNASQPTKWITKIELPESGNYLEFPMSAEEILLAKSQDALAAAARKKGGKICASEKTGVESETIEMVDGAVAIFAGKNSRIVNGVNPWDLINDRPC